jgi:hypothetical protein
MNEHVPYIAYDEEMARNERHVKRLITALVITIVLLALSNMMWLWAWTRYDYASETVDVQSSGYGTANYIGTNGQLIYGADPRYKAAKD